MNDNEKNIRNPVRDVYDQYRTARFNVRYYENQLSILRLWNFVIELTLAFSASTGFATLWIWNTSVGTIIWKVLLAIAAVLALAKPLLGFSDKIQQNSEVLTKWRALDGEFQKLTMKISQFKEYTPEMRDNFLKLLEIKVAIKEPERINDRLRNKSFSKVNDELPLDSFFIPEEKTK